MRNPATVDPEPGSGHVISRPCNETSMSYIYSLSVLTAYSDAITYKDDL